MAKRQPTQDRPARRAKSTLLLVGEGFDEVAFLRHVKSIFVARGAGISVAIKNAYGKGARHVVSVAIKQSNNTHYDQVAALFDTDTDWNAAVQDNARQKNIRVLLSTPCFEAMLLRSAGLATSSPVDWTKERLRSLLGGPPNDQASYKGKFTREALENAAAREGTLRALIDLLSN